MRAEACFPGKVVDMGHQPLHEVVEPCIAALRIDSHHVLGDVINGEVEKRRGVASCGCHG